MSLADFALDLEKESQGTWITVGGMEFKVARAGNDDFTKYVQKAFIEKMGEERPDQTDEEQAEEYKAITLNAFVETILMEWKGVKLVDDGDDLEYSKESAKEIFGDPTYKLLRKRLEEASDNFSNYRAKQEDEDVKK